MLDVKEYLVDGYNYGTDEKIEITESQADGCVGGSGYYQFFPDCNKTIWVSWGYRIGGSSGASFKNDFGGNRWYWGQRWKYYY